MANYWNSKKAKSVIAERRAELKLLIELANLGLMQTYDPKLQKRVLGHLYQSQALHPNNRDWRPGKENVDRIANYVADHIRSRLKDIFQKNSAMELWDDLPLWSLSGTIDFSIDPKSHGFHEQFQFLEVSLDGGSENENIYKFLGLLSKVVDLLLIEIVRHLDLSKGHLCRCSRCRSFFYNPTKKEITYCSKKCTDAMRQQKYRKEKEGKDE